MTIIEKIIEKEKLDIHTESFIYYLEKTQDKFDIDKISITFIFQKLKDIEQEIFDIKNQLKPYANENSTTGHNGDTEIMQIFVRCFLETVRNSDYLEYYSYLMGKSSDNYFNLTSLIEKVLEQGNFTSININYEKIKKNLKI